MNIWILAGPIGSGKTTRLDRWARAKPSARGILSPVVDGERHFLHLPDRERRDMAAGPDEQAVYTTPRYRFSATAFHWAEDRLREDARLHPDWLLIDEIGKLELRGEGFATCLRAFLEQAVTENLLLVVRDNLVEAITGEFGIDAFSRWAE